MLSKTQNKYCVFHSKVFGEELVVEFYLGDTPKLKNGMGYIVSGEVWNDYIIKSLRQQSVSLVCIEDGQEYFLDHHKTREDGWKVLNRVYLTFDEIELVNGLREKR